MNPIFEKAEPKHIPLIQDLARKSWESAYAGILSEKQIEYMLNTMYSDAEILSQISHHTNYHYYLVSSCEKTIGFIGFEHHYEPDTTKLHRIYLLPEAKGKGVGKSSITFLKKQTEKSGDSRIILNVNKNNTARNFYETQGFRLYSEGTFDIGNGFVMDDFLMEFKFC